MKKKTEDQEIEMRKELELFRAAFQKLLDHSEERDREMKNMMVEFREGMIEVKRVTEIFDGISFTSKVAIGIGGLAMFLGSAYMLGRSIFHAQNN